MKSFKIGSFQGTSLSQTIKVGLFVLIFSTFVFYFCLSGKLPENLSAIDSSHQLAALIEIGNGEFDKFQDFAAEYVNFFGVPTPMKINEANLSIRETYIIPYDGAGVEEISTLYTKSISRSQKQKYPYLRDLERLPFKRWYKGRHLLVTYFESGYSAARSQELRAVLIKNLKNKYIHYVHVLWEGGQSPIEYFLDGDILTLKQYKKLVLIRTRKQPTYATFVAYANAFLMRGAVAIISNADIIMGDSMKCVRWLNEKKNRKSFYSDKRLILALSRHPDTVPCAETYSYDNGTKPILKSHNQCLVYHGSHDTFIFAPPLSNSLLPKLDFVQNRLGAENRVIWAMLNQTYRVANPCRRIKVYHRHCDRSQRHTPQGRIAKLGDEKFADANPVTKYSCNDIIY